MLKERSKSTILSPHPEFRNRSRCFIKVEACLPALLSLMLISTTAFGQGGAASMSGTIQDTSGGVLPGASVVIRNVDTGIETRATTNCRRNL